MTDCTHVKVHRMYKRGPRPEQAFLPTYWACDACGERFSQKPEAAKTSKATKGVQVPREAKA